MHCSLGDFVVKQPLERRAKDVLLCKVSSTYDRVPFRLSRHCCSLDHSGLLVRVRLTDQKIPYLKPDSTKNPPCLWYWYTLNFTSKAKHLLADMT
ncbi:hypothetical protein AVEN_136041-1 [Araneus ventricosus]|uniref:Uncharacterized protein n=1 Tax=Araneus ventricosus TaxID=182803 RepID=A0A4Y2EX40_ARAVE|nr:hypothetical protein AVEN_136041-1 [Araneus ventricosus]